MTKRFDSYDEFIRDLDESDRYADDSYDVEVGALDQEDLDLLNFGKAKTKRAPKSRADA